MTKRVNSNKEKVNSNNTVIATNVASDRIKNANYELSKKLNSSIKNVSFKFSAVRSAILAYVANEKTLSKYNKDKIIVLLRESKKDRELYLTLIDLCEFSYKSIKTKNADKVDQIDYKKAYTVSSVLKACDLYFHVNKDLNVSLRSSFVQEFEVIAINKLKNQIAKLQDQVKLIADTIEQLHSDVDDQVNKNLVTEYSEQLAKSEKQLQSKTQLFEYVSIKSNRSQIK